MQSKSSAFVKQENELLLRQLELIAYSSLVSALRAEGPLTEDKRHHLEATRKILNINIDMHRSEIRRAINDEKLREIFYYINGSHLTYEDWINEGRMTLPLLQKISPQTLQPVMSQCNLSTSQNKYRIIKNEKNIDQLKTSGNKNNSQAPLSEQQSSSLEVKRPLIKRLKLTNYYNVKANNNPKKTILVETSKMNTLNPEKFKIISKSALLSEADDKIKSQPIPSKIKITKTLIPLSQFQLLNYKLKSKDAIKLLPRSYSTLKTLNNMIRVTNESKQANLMEIGETTSKLNSEEGNQVTDEKNDSNKSEDNPMLTKSQGNLKIEEYSEPKDEDEESKHVK